MKLDRSEFGRATEARFLHDAIQRGLRVLRPFDSLPDYDCVVESPRGLLRVQIKGARRYSSPDTETYYVGFSARKRDAIARRPVRPVGAEVVAIWLEEDARWVFCRGEDVGNRTGITVPALVRVRPRKRAVFAPSRGVLQSSVPQYDWSIFDAPTPKIDTISGGTPPAIPAETQPTSST